VDLLLYVLMIKGFPTPLLYPKEGRQYMVGTKSVAKFVMELSQYRVVYNSNSMFISLSIYLLRSLSYLLFYNPPDHGVPLGLIVESLD
jgi:hypothetical protein